MERACDDFLEPYPAEPSLPACSHAGLFEEEGDREDCFEAPFGDECFGKPKKPDYCQDLDY